MSSSILCPVKCRVRYIVLIDLHREFGYTLPEPYSKVLKGTPGLKELRVKLVSDICRLFYFHHKEKVYVVMSGYVKKRNETDNREVEQAIRL